MRNTGGFVIKSVALCLIVLGPLAALAYYLQPPLPLAAIVGVSVGVACTIAAQAWQFGEERSAELRRRAEEQRERVRRIQRDVGW